MAVARCFSFWWLVLPLRVRNNFMVKLKIVLNLQNFSAQNYMLSFSALGLYLSYCKTLRISVFKA